MFCFKPLIEVNSKSKIFDHVGATSNSNFLREYLYILNGLRYYKKYHQNRLTLILFSTLAKLIKALFFFDKIKLKALYYGHVDFFKVLKGENIDIKKRIKNNS